MEWNVKDLENIVAFINTELKNKPMADIEKEFFGVNARVIHKRLIRLGYKRKGKMYIKEVPGDTPIEVPKVVQEKKEVIQVNTPKVIQIDMPKAKIIEETKEVVQNPVKPNKQEDIYNSIEVLQKEVQELKEEVRKLKLDKYKALYNSISSTNIEVVREVKQRTFKVDKNVLKEWDKYIKKNKNYKAQELISAALKQYMENNTLD